MLYVMKHTLESSTLFPIIAWTLIISFSFFTYVLAKNLTNTVETIEMHHPQTLQALHPKQLRQ